MKKRIISVMLACVMVMSTLAGCSNNEGEKQSSTVSSNVKETTSESEVKTSEETVPQEKEREYVELVVYNYVNNSKPQPGTEETLEKINEYLKEKLNCTLDMHIYNGVSAYNETVSTIVSSGAEFDMVLSGATRVPFTTFASQNAYLPLEDYVDEYLPVTKSQVPEAAWDAFTINGHLYAVPLFRDFATIWGYLYNDTLLKDLGLEFPEKYSTGTDLYDFFYEVKAARDKKNPELAKKPITRHIAADKFLSINFFYEGLITSKDLVVANIPGLEAFAGYGSGEKVICPYYTEEYRALVKKMNQMVQDYVFPFDTGYDADGVLSKAGQLLGYFSQGTVYWDENTMLPYYTEKLKGADEAILTLSGLQGGGYAISAESKNVERCLEVIDLIASDEYLATLFRFGPEGVSWTDKDNDGVVELTDLNTDASNRYFYQWYGWNLGGLLSSKVPPSTPANIAELIQDANTIASPGYNLGFIVDTTPIVNEIAACNSVVDEYHKVLAAGQNNDVDKAVDDFVAKLKASGMDKILEEVQKQLDAWRQSK